MRYWFSFLFGWTIIVIGQPLLANELYYSQNIKQLLAQLDLEQSALSEVKKSLDHPTQAVAALLKYYKNRQGINHPINRNQKSLQSGKYADENDLKIANEALQHIFVGQRAYPSFFAGEDIDWGLRPVSDNEWVWQLNRMYFWDAMARAYWHTGNEQYAEEWTFQLKDWVKKNPRDSEHHYAWRSIEAGIRGYRWTSLFQHFIDAPSFTGEVLVAFLTSLHEHATFLMTQYRSGSNWALMEAEGLAFIAITFPEFKEAKKWQHEAIRRLNLEMNKQVYEDGHQRELSINYHMGSIRWFIRTYQLAKMNGLQEAFPDSYLQKIEKMCEVPLKVGFQDGSMPQFGDSWSGEPGQYAEQYREWSELFDRPDFLYYATAGKEGKRPDSTAYALPISGFYSMKSGWDTNDISFVLKCGPDGGGHCQPDNGTFELYAGGRHLMPDAGSYIYSGDPENRAWFRQTRVHQTLTLNEENADYNPKLLLWKPGEELDILIVENKSYESLTHRRAVFFVDKQFFVLVDEAYGDGTGNVDIHFQLAPGPVHFDESLYTVRSDFPDGYNVLVQSISQPGMTIQKEEGQVSFEYTKKQPRPAFRYRINKQKQESVRFVTVVEPFRVSPSDIDVQIIGEPEIGGNKMSLQLNVNGQSKIIRYKLN